MQQFYSNYAERLFYYFKRLFILICVVQFICVIAFSDDDALLTQIFFILLAVAIIASFMLEYFKRNTFPIIEILGKDVFVKIGNEEFHFDLYINPCEVYCNTAFSINGLSLSYDKDIIFNEKDSRIKIFLNKFSANKVMNIKSLIEHFYAAPSIVLPTESEIADRPVITVANNRLRPIIITCIAIICAFWLLIALVIIQEGIDIPKLLMCIGACLAMIASVILSNINSLIRIQYVDKLILTTFLGKRIELDVQEVSKIDMKRVSNNVGNLIHYVDIRLRNGKQTKYKISLSSEEEKVKFIELAKYLENKT